MANAQDLDKLKADLKSAQDSMADLTKKTADIQSQVKTLEAKLLDIQKATEGYQKASADMQRQLDDDGKAIARKTTIAEAAIEDLKGPIDKAIADFDKALADSGNTAKAAADKAATAADEAATAIQGAINKQSDYNGLKGLPKALMSQLKDVKDLLDAITKSEAQDDPVAMYFYVQEAAAQAKNILIPKPEEYEKQLADAQDNIDAAQAEAAKRKALAEQAASEAASAKKAFDSAVAVRRTELLKVLHSVKAPVPAHA